MTIKFIKPTSNLDYWNLKATVRINTVNCVGVMGKGIAHEFKQRHNSMYLEYLDRCKLKMLRPGMIFQYEAYEYWVINAATKDHWKDPSKLEWVVSALKEIRTVLQRRSTFQIDTVALPALGCGNGGLDWSVVRPVVENEFADLSCDIHVFEPIGTSGLF